MGSTSNWPEPAPHTRTSPPAVALAAREPSALKAEELTGSLPPGNGSVTGAPVLVSHTRTASGDAVSSRL